MNTPLPPVPTITDAALTYADHVQELATAADEAHKAELNEALAAQKAESDKALADATAGKAKQTGALGAQPFTLADDGEESQTGDPIQDFDGAVLMYMNRHKVERRQAINAVKRNHPDMAKAYLLATNPSQRSKRELTERFDALNV